MVNVAELSEGGSEGAPERKNIFTDLECHFSVFYMLEDGKWDGRARAKARARARARARGLWRGKTSRVV